MSTRKSWLLPSSIQWHRNALTYTQTRLHALEAITGGPEPQYRSLYIQPLKLRSIPTPPRLDLSAQQVKAIPLHRDWPELSQFRGRDVSLLLGAMRYRRARPTLASF